MGWWQAGTGGGIGMMVGGLTEYINGDEPADILGNAVEAVLKLLQKVKPKQKLTEQQIIEMFLADKPRWPKHLKPLPSGVLSVIKKAWEDVDKAYMEAGKRKAHPEERRLALEFVVGTCRERIYEPEKWAK